MKRGVILSLLLSIFTITIVLAVNLRRIIRAIEKQDFQRAIEWLDEEIKEEPFNPGAYLLYSQVLSIDTLKYYDLDRARDYIDVAIEQYDTASIEIKEDLEKLAIYEFTIDNTYDNIKKQTFSILSDKNTLESYIDFISLYPDSEEAYTAIERRDSIAYQYASEQDSWTAYRDYFQTYPNSKYAPIAEVRYERLLYEDMTVSNTVSSLSNFIEKYPNSPFRDRTISRLFAQKMNTFSWDEYLGFVRQFPGSEASQKALDIMFHINKERYFKEGLIEYYSRKDSLIKSYNETGQQLIAFLDREKVGLLYPNGEIFMPATYQRILNQNVFCETFTEDVIAYQEGDSSLLTNRSGDIFHIGDFSTLSQDSTGLVWVDENNGLLLHKNGDILYSAVDDFLSIDGKWIILKRGSRFALGSYSGNLLSKFIFTAVKKEGDFYVFTRSKNEVAVYTSRSLKEDARDGVINPSFRFDEIELVAENILIGFNDVKECLLDENLAFLIPWGDHEIYPDPEIYYTKQEGVYRLYNDKYIASLGTNTCSNLISSAQWLAIKNDFWKVINLEKGELFLKQYDSAFLLNDKMLLTQSGKERRIHFSNGETLKIDEKEDFFKVPSSQNEQTFIGIATSKEKKYYNDGGQFLFSSKDDEVVHLKDTLFKMTRRGKYGVVTTSGEQLLSTKYDLIQVKGNQLYTLIDGEIGNYDLEAGIAFDADYEAAFDKQSGYYKTRLDGKYGVLDKEKEIVLPFEYNQVEVLNDSLIWAETDTAWLMITAYENLVLRDDVRSFAPIQKGGDAYLLFTKQGYGIMNSGGTFIVNPVFSDIRLLTDGGKRIYRAEKYFQEAGFYILVWYDDAGKKIYSNAYRKDDYERLYCE